MSRFLQKPVVLLVSQQLSAIAWVRRALGSSVYLLEADDLDEALGFLTQTTVDVTIIDGSLEKPFEISSEIKQKLLKRTAPILLITGKLKRAYIQRLAAAGANGFIREPLEEQDLIERIQEAEKFQTLGKKLEEVADTALHTPSKTGDITQKLFLDKSLLEPFYATIKMGKPISLLAIAIEYSDKHEFTEQQITQIINRIINPSDLLIPLSHGKYALILNHTQPKEALFLAETLRDVITHTLHISIAIGITSQKKPPYANIHDMIFDAKKALLTAEQKGISIETNH